ncbi:MAG: hypothetical protein LQ341_006817 [Variospora aurantia]|nr:MAG: hypothetical protein LQ341_006817 [Variospora aurantia]
MASATGIPEGRSNAGRGEDEPLLGRAGDASQQEDQGLQFNFVIGTAVIAQVGIWVLLNSAGILLTTQAILLLQPTHTPTQKRQGTNIHATLNMTAILSLIAALVVIEYNKIAHNGAHFQSPHAILGLITYILFFLQAIIGIAQYYTPGVFGSVTNAKKIYKYHRMSGYVILLMSFITIAAATQTGFNVGVLHIQLWAVIVASVITLIGVLPRIKKQKLGL